MEKTSRWVRVSALTGLWTRRRLIAGVKSVPKQGYGHEEDFWLGQSQCLNRPMDTKKTSRWGRVGDSTGARTRRRVVVQRWPAVPTAAKSTDRTIMSRSASSITTMALLPPTRGQGYQALGTRMSITTMALLPPTRR